ncbi:MAG: extracellular solute-binding protein [Leucobacter sp.]
MNVQIDRRKFLIGAGAVVASGLLLSACSTSKTGGAGGELLRVAPGTEVDATGTVRWTVWPGELSPETLDQIAKDLPDIQLDFVESMNDAQAFLSTARPQLESGLPVGFDLISLSGAIAPVFMSNDWLMKLDKSTLPNVEKYMFPEFKSLPGSDYMIPFDHAPMGIAYAEKQFPGGITTWEDLLDPRLKGRVALYSEYIASISSWAVYLKAKGEIDHYPAELTVEEAKTVIGFIKPHVDSGQLRTSSGENFTQQLASGDIWAAIASPATVAANRENGVKMAIPEEGVAGYVDYLAIPIGAENPRGAEEIMNYLYDPAVFAQFLQWTMQNPVVDGVQEAMKTVDPSLANDELIFLDQGIRERVHLYPPNWDEAQREEVSSMWAAATGA